MGFFDSKAKRIAHHRQLLGLAKATLDQLKIEPFKKDGEATDPIWTEASKQIVSLEYRWWLSIHVETLVCAVYDTTDAELGDRDWIRELVESLNAARAVLAGLPETTRQRFRADTFARIQASLDGYITDAAKWLATDNSLMLVLADLPLDNCLQDARTALTWFPSQDRLEAACNLRNRVDKELPRPSLYDLEKLVRDGGVVLEKVREYQARVRQEREGPQTSRSPEAPSPPTPPATPWEKKTGG